MPNKQITTKANNGKRELVRQIRKYVLTLLEEKTPASEISFALSYIATEMGLAIAKQPTDVFPFVLNGISQAVLNSHIDEGNKEKANEDVVEANPNTTVH